MKKLDKLILSSFIGPFILTFLVVVFILLVQHMLKYFDDIVGKDIGLETLGMLMFDFAIFMTPIAIPLAVLLSSLMTFGNLGEHFELTAVKSAGISLLRTLYPIFIFVCFLTVVAFYSNNYFVPKAALNAYSVLWDIKQTKPALDLKEGAFYNGIPDISIKVNEKNSETGEIKDVIIYDHRNRDGNKQVVLADSGRMYTINNDSYLVLELFHGQFYVEGNANSKTVSSKRSADKPESLSRATFSTNKLIFDLSSFDMEVTDKSLFASNRIMRNLEQLEGDIDSLNMDKEELELDVFIDNRYFFTYLDEKNLPLTPELTKYKLIKDSIDEANEALRLLEIQKEDSLIEVREKEKELPAPKKDNKVVKKGSSIRGENKLKVKKNPIINRKGSNGEKHLPKKEGIDDSGLKQIDAEERRGDNKRSPKINSKKDNLVPEDLKDGTAMIPDSIKLKLQKNRREREAMELEKKQKKLDDFISDTVLTSIILKSAVNTVRQNKSKLTSHISTNNRNREGFRTFQVQWHKIIANSFACIVMFLIGAPLGAIIKRGGLGFPVLISIFFFIIFYVFTMTGEKWAKQGIIDPMLGMWSSNILLFPIGLFFLRQARNDARLFDADFYNVVIARIKARFGKTKENNL